MKLIPILLLVSATVVFSTCQIDSGLLIARNDSNKFGLQGSRHNKEFWVTPCVYDGIEELISGDYYKVKQNGKLGVINKTGEIIFPCTYSKIEQVNNGGETVCLVLTDSSGIWIGIPARRYKSNSSYDSVWVTSDYSVGPIFARSCNKYDLITGGGRIILEKCDTIAWQNVDCWESLILYMKNGNCGICNLSGRVLIPAVYDSIHCWPQAECRVLPVQLDGEMCYINHSGKQQKPLFDSRMEHEFMQRGGEMSVGSKR